MLSNNLEKCNDGVEDSSVKNVALTAANKCSSAQKTVGCPEAKSGEKASQQQAQVCQKAVQKRASAKAHRNSDEIRRKQQLTARQRHRTYARNEQKIREMIVGMALMDRNISTRVSDVCKLAKLSMPTFYLHHKNCNDVLSSYENELMAEFRKLMARKNSRTDIFNLLLIFVQRHRKYFRACFASQNLYLLTKMLIDLRKYLVKPGIGRKTYAIYSATIMALLVWWGWMENFSKDLIPEYARELKNLRMVYYR